MTTWDLQPSGGDYTSLDAALSNASTVAGDIIEISGDWSSTTDTTSATVADDNITIRTRIGDQARHAGFDNGGSNYELAVTDGATAAIQVDNDGCVIDGLLVLQNATGSSDECIRKAVSGGTLRVINTICRATNNTSDQDGIYSSVAGTLEIENVACMGFGRAGLQAQNLTTSGTQTWNIISYTGWNNGRNSGETDGGGVSGRANQAGATTNLNIHNSACLENTSASSNDFDLAAATPGTVNWQIDNCISSDFSITSRDSGAVNANEGFVIGETDTSDAQGDMLVNDITTAPFDLRLKDDANNDAQDQHANATGAGITIGAYVTGTEDVAGTTRPVNTNYDIGFFEVVSGNFETLAATATGVATLSTAIQISRALDAVATGIATLTRLATWRRALSATASGISTLVAATLGEFFETLSAVATGVATINRRLSARRALSATSTGIAALVAATAGQFFETITAVATGVANLDRRLSLTRNLSATAVGSAAISLGLQLSRVLTATATGVAGVFRRLSVFRTLSATATGNAVMAAGRLFQETLAAIATGITALTAVFTEAPEEPTTPFSGHAGIRMLSRGRWRRRVSKWKRRR